jgi:hypothetical protein
VGEEGGFVEFLEIKCVHKNLIAGWVFVAVKQTWSKPIVKGKPPTARDSHTCTAVGNNLYVFGGTDGTSPLGDLHVLDTGQF